MPALLPRLWRFAVVLSGDRETANDLVQATCTRAIEKEEQFIAGTRLDLWTFSILSSVWKNQLRSMAVRKGVGQVSAEEALTGDLSIELETTITTRQVLTAVGRLPETHRSAVLLVYVEGCSYRQAAETLEIPVGTLMSRLAAAKAGLARTLTVPGGRGEAHDD